MSDTQRARLERAFETLKRNNVLPILKLTGSTGVIEDSLEDYRLLADAVGTTNWVGAHVGAAEHRGGYWDAAGRLRYRYDDSPVLEVWFAYPRGREDLAKELIVALEQQAFYVTWGDVDAGGTLIRPGTVFDSVRLVLKEED